MTDHVIVDAAELEEMARSALLSERLEPRQAADTARVLVLADLLGIGTHGVRRVPEYIGRSRQGGMNSVASITHEHVAPSVIRVHGDNGFGPAAAMHGLRAAMDTAEEQGCCVAAIRESNHCGALMPYCLTATEQSFGILMCSSATPTMAPWGGADRRLGNSPFAIGVPNTTGDPLLLDIAMSVVARGKIRAAASEGTSIPDTWAFDSHGQPTTDPAAAIDGLLAPIGGYKGYGLAAMVDALAGLLSGAAFLTGVSSWSLHPERPQNLGHFIVVFKADLFGGPEWLGARMAEFGEILHGSPAAADSPVLLPGEREMKNYHEQMAHGVRVERRDYEELGGLLPGRYPCDVP